MSQKFMSLVFVSVFAGCHSPPQGAVCPSTEEEVAEPEPTSEDEVPADQQKIPEAELRRAKRRGHDHFLPSR